MIKKYLYNDKEYLSEYSVRQAIWKEDHKVFGKEPEENRAEFWETLGVTYSEQPDPPIVQHIPTLEEEKTIKLARLNDAFQQWRNNDATLISSLGFTADADERAMIDVSGLVALDSPATFMDADNVPHELSAEELKTLQKEIIQSGNQAYQVKWSLRNAINEAETKEALDNIELTFTPVDFSEVENVQ